MVDTKNIELYYLHRPVANLAALKAIDTTSIVDGEIISVNGYGVGYFVKASTATPDDLTIVQPTVGGGRWYFFYPNSPSLFTKTGTLIHPTTLGDGINSNFGFLGNTDLSTGYTSRFITILAEYLAIDNEIVSGSISTGGDGWQSFTAIDSNYFTKLRIYPDTLAGIQLISVYNGDGIGGTLITSWSQNVTGIITAPAPIKLTLGQSYTIRFQGNAFDIPVDGGSYTGGKFKGSAQSTAFTLYEKTWNEAFNISKTTGLVSMPTLSLANGIVQINSVGLLSSSTVLPNGTTGTTQVWGTDDTKLATCKFVNNAVDVENLWDRVGTTLYTRHSGDNINILSGCFSNVDTPSDANLYFYGYAETVSIQQPTDNAAESTSGDGWQSFTAINSDFVTKISISVFSGASNQTVSVYAGEGPPYGTALWTSGLLNFGIGFNDIVVSTPFPISIGQKYTIRIQGASFYVRTWYGPPGPYVGGSWMGSNNSDLEFKIWTTGISATMILQRSTGRLGLGTLTPAEMFDVVGKIKSSDTIYAPTLTATTEVLTGRLRERVSDAGINVSVHGHTGKFYDYTDRWFTFSSTGVPDDGCNIYIPYSPVDGWFFGYGIGATHQMFFGTTGTEIVMYGNGAYECKTLKLTGTVGGATVTKINNSTTLVGASATTLSTDGALKTYIDGKISPSSLYNFIATKNVNQNNVTGDNTYLNVTYGNEIVDIGNNFGGTFFVAPSNCVFSGKISTVFDIAAGTNTYYAMNLRRVNSSDVLQETVPVSFGLIADNLDAFGNASILGKASDIRMYTGDKLSVYVVVAGNATKNISLTSYDYQRFSGFVTALV